MRWNRESFRQFLAESQVEISLRRYGIDALNGMALGLFASLIIGLILKMIGMELGSSFLLEAGKTAQSVMGPAIAVGIAVALKAPVLVVLASVGVGAMGASLGGPMGAFLSALVGTECGKLISKRTPVDIIATPALTLLMGALVALLVGPSIESLMTQTGAFIMWAVELQPFWMGIVLAVVMGMILTLPISSAAIAISLSLGGLAAGAATVGCCAQMVGFAVMSFRENRWAGVLSQGLGTSMLQMPNIVRNPRIWLPTILASAILGPLSTMLFGMLNVPIGAGMGSSGLVGQVGTLEAMGRSVDVFLAIGLLHFLLPALLCLLFAFILRRLGWIREGDLKLNL